ncbi:hypothetical protein CAOG_009999 [Capsaspora owczarzaki ATCC 30864]|uniref:Uncharacterized protein n=1 Tax=Capsaspora owczarzaki (strain ATCC 30864) TaxID=595528 RepID=A0A0D2VX42_CAPO3|nr:hypothetical protein CAOG_009999 [Capsaspora owczarzaki ATCC 30864]
MNASNHHKLEQQIDTQVRGEIVCADDSPLEVSKRHDSLEFITITMTTDSAT